jgi:glycosyltransferase involved in cell wall biosynthesis
MYQECVVITTNTNGIHELIENGADGFVVEKSDWESGLVSIKQINESQGTLLDNRSEGSPLKVTARHSLLRYGRRRN